MKIYLENENLRKIVYDILNIFYDKKDFSFVGENEDISIKNGLVNTKDKSYFFDSNLKLKEILFEIFKDESKKIFCLGDFDRIKTVKTSKKS